VNAVRLTCAAALAALLLAYPARAIDLLPDLIINPARLNDYVFVKNIVPGKVHVRFSNATPNIGRGPLLIYPGGPSGNGQRVFQRIFLSQGGFRDRQAGVFLYHPTHNHFHFGSWAQYTIRAVLPGDGVGPVLRTGGKTSFCLLDSARYTGPGPVLGTPPNSSVFRTCGDDAQGISVGWEDLYSRTLPDQWIDITGLGPGSYWLEAVVDPSNLIEEVNEDNNVGRIKITLTPGQVPVPDEIPLNPRLPIVLSLVLLFMGAGMLALRTKLRGKSSS
jgi:hypothetical protein